MNIIILYYNIFGVLWICDPHSQYLAFSHDMKKNSQNKDDATWIIDFISDCIAYYAY